MNILLPAEPKENNPVDINQLRTRILIYLMYISGGCTYALLPIWARVFIEDFSFSNGQVGLLTSADMASTALAAFLGRFWIDKVYWRKVMPVVLIVTAIANMLCAFSESFSSLLMLRYIAGFGTGSIAVFTYGTLSAVEKPDREFAFASAISVAVGIALLTISPTMISQWGSGVTFLMLCVIVLLPLPLRHALPPVNPTKQATVKTAPLKNALTHSDSAARFGLMMAFIFIAAISSIWTFAERIGSAEGLDVQFISFVLSIILLVEFIAFSISGLLAGRVSRPTLLSCGFVLMFIFAYLIGNKPTAMIFAIALCGYSFASCLLLPVQNGWIASLDPTGKQLILLPVAQSLGAALGPLLAGIVATGNQYSNIPDLSIGLLILALMFAFFMSRAEKLHAMQHSP